ncbi:MAG: MarR family transcriptional regulator [Dokdonella sp.]|uniref:MarR family winged helix-turn-helix transcriptional regulator n=1 Tax=Dokdonella sp. TaxID=2291710 RepID=UPI0025BB04E6|nr:MarR family transcriptional regulator [Dokdonella sp.]MBX3700227.1 MarR family transcriptional regulator [Dokdonella sp.]MCW5578532.1 MarR family transcriptional regulator [Dokdonella sp.]
MPDRTTLELHEFLPYRLSVLANRSSDTLAREYSQRFGLGVTEWRVMAVLGRYPGLSANEVAQRTAMDKVAVSRAVARLLAADRLRREFADHDRRRSVLRLSAAGQAIYEQIVPLALGYEKLILAGMSRSERELLFRLLDRLDELELRAEHSAAHGA